MTGYETLAFVGLGLLCGMAGQGMRVVVGFKKKAEKRMEEWFDVRVLGTSLLIGAVAGFLGAVSLLDSPINKQTLITLITIGYAGTDFIEGFVRARH